MKHIQNKIKSKKERNDIFNTANKLELGPGDYEPKKTLTMKNGPINNFAGTTSKEKTQAEKF